MTTGVVCPHCETRFQLNRDLLGKSIRCPNRDCDEVFEVVDSDAGLVSPEPAAPATPASSTDPLFDFRMPPQSKTGDVSELLIVLDGQPEIQPRIPETLEHQRIFDAEVIPSDGPPLAKVVAAPARPNLQPAPLAPLAPKPAKPGLPVVKSQPAPKEVDWASAEPPALVAELLRAGAPPVRTSSPDDDEVPIRSRPKKKSGVSKLVFWGLVALLLGIVGGTIYTLFLREAASERQRADEAEGLFNEGKFGDANKRFEELLTDYPLSESADKYRFLSRFSSAQSSIGSMATRDDPDAARKLFSQFTTDFTESLFVKPKDGYGALVDQAGQKLVSIYHDHAEDRIKEFRKDRTKSHEPLNVAEKSVSTGLALLNSLDRFRDPATPAPDSLRVKFAAVSGEITKERNRLATLAPWRNLANDPTEARIEDFETAMLTAGLAKDAEVQRLAEDSRVAIRKSISFTPDEEPARRGTTDPGTIAFVAPYVQASPEPKAVTDGRETESLHLVNRGVLYALDWHDGRLRWAARVGATSELRPPEPLAVQLGDGAGELVLIPTNLGGRPALVARRGGTGEPEWSQALPAPVWGPPVHLGGSVYVGLQDELGTILQFDLRTGQRKGGLELRQRLGSPLAVLPGATPDRGFLLAVADSRRAFIFDCGRAKPDGERLPPTCVRILRTEHPKDSLLGDVLLIAPPDAQSARRLLLAQKFGTKATKLRVFSLPNAAELTKSTPDAETPAELTTDATVAGHLAYQPISDGERVAVGTDTGSFAVFGIALPGDADKPLFKAPGSALKSDADQLDPAQVIAADSDAYWVLSGGRATRLRIASDATNGPRLVQGGAVKLGENTLTLGSAAGRSHIQLALSSAAITIHPDGTDTTQVVAFDLESGQVKWWRQLGAVAVEPPIPASGGPLLVDQCGGVYQLARETDPQEKLPRLIAKPLAKPVAGAKFQSAGVAISSDGKSVWVAVAEMGQEGKRLLVRRFREGKAAGEVSVPLAGQLAGPVAVLGEKLLLPLSDGVFYRVGIDDQELEKGTPWRSGKADGDTRCHLSVIGLNEFLISDGQNSVLRFKWDGKDAVVSGGPWRLPNPISRAPVLSTAGQQSRYWLSDAKGVVFLVSPTKAGEPLKRWIGTADGPIPAGAATAPTAAAGNLLIGTADRKIVFALDPDQDEPAWVLPELPNTGEVAGLSSTGSSVIVTYASGLVREHDAQTRELLREATGAPARTGATRFDDGDVLVPGANGSVEVVPLVPVNR